MATKVIDVSEHQGVIDWEKVKKSGITGAIIRCGYGSDDASQDDKQWKRNVTECERLGIPYGVYLYSYATNTNMAQSEALHAIRLCKGHKLTYPLFFDSEEPGTQGVAKACAKAFCEAVKKAGYTPGIYASRSWWQTYLTGLDGYVKWVAEWGVSKCAIGCAFWQYADNGKVSGIDGAVDMNYCYKDYGTAKKPSTIKAKKPIATVANEVVAGKWGNGATRKKKLEAAGYDYEKVQAQVNKILAAKAAKVVKVGAKVKIKKGAHQYGSTALFADGVYHNVYKVVEIRGNRVVFATSRGVVMGAVSKANCIVQ